MYEEKTIDLVAASIPVLERQTTPKPYDFPRDHFACRTCKSPPLGSTRLYTTVEIAGFGEERDTLGHFVYSSQDQAYGQPNTRLEEHLALPLDGRWYYTNVTAMQGHDPFVRGYWLSPTRMVHHHQRINLGMFVEDTEDMHDMYPEIGLRFHVPPTTGAYFVPGRGLEHRPTTVDEEYHMLRASEPAAVALNKRQPRNSWQRRRPSTLRMGKPKKVKPFDDDARQRMQTTRQALADRFVHDVTREGGVLTYRTRPPGEDTDE